MWRFDAMAARVGIAEASVKTAVVLIVVLQTQLRLSARTVHGGAGVGGGVGAVGA